MSTEIFMPVYQLSMLTFLVFVLILILRTKSIYFDKKHSSQDWVVPRFQGGSKILTYAQRNFTNLLEFPILFYSVCIVIYVTGNVDDYFVELACWFFWLRAVHSIIHIFYNKIVPVVELPLRAIPWLVSVATVVWMWIRIVPML
tara:strand:- start:709 stop:1140 length:432 start_codon:yes stop_codon:yes gene_type:complete